MNMLGGPRPGTWSLSSKKDPRWNCNGQSDFISISGWPEEARKEFERMKFKLGVPPDDLELTCTKD